jgi:hypothetical protein
MEQNRGNTMKIHNEEKEKVVCQAEHKKTNIITMFVGSMRMCTPALPHPSPIETGGMSL